MSTQSKAKIIRALFAAYLSNNRKAVKDAFTDDFRFTSPYDDEIDKATYFVRCWRVTDSGSSGMSWNESSSRATRPL